MNKFIHYFKYSFLSLVFAGFSCVHAGVYEDFFRAVRLDDVRTVRQLLERGFDPNTLNPEKRTGLMLAAGDPDPSLRVAELLIAQKATQIDAINPAGESALMLASLRGHQNLVKLLLDRDAEVNKTGWTALHYAATGGHIGIMRQLLEAHAYVDAESPNGTTPLMMAAQYGGTEAMKFLLAEGALPTLKNQLGLTALDFARLGGRRDAIELMEQLLKPVESEQPSPNR